MFPHKSEEISRYECTDSDEMGNHFFKRHKWRAYLIRSVDVTTHLQVSDIDAFQGKIEMLRRQSSEH